MRHWDEIVALKRRIGIDDSFKPLVLHPLRPAVMTEKHRITGITFENMTSQDEKFLCQKFGLKQGAYVDAALMKEITTSMRIDLFYQTAECRLVPEKMSGQATRMAIPGIYMEKEKEWDEADGVRMVLTAGSRKSVQLHGGARYDSEEYASVQFGLDIPLKTAVPVNTDITLRLGKRLMAHGELTVHPRNFTRPMLSFTFRRNDIDVYFEGNRDYNIRYNHFQAELTPINFDFRHFNLQLGVRWDYMHYRNALGSESSQQLTLENEHFYSYRGRIEYDSEDSWYFPTRGARFNAEYAYLTDNFAKLDGATGMSDVSADWRMSFTFGSRFTLQPMLYGRMLLGPVVPSVMGNTVGGDRFGLYVEKQMPFAGIGGMEYVAHQFVAFQLQAQQRIGTSSYLLFRMAGAQHADKLKALLDRRTLLGGQVAYYYNTMAGPVGATLGYSNRTKKLYFYLNLGYEF